MSLKIIVTDYNSSGHNQVFLVEKYPTSISFDGGRLNIDGVSDTLYVSNDWNVTIEEVK